MTRKEVNSLIDTLKIYRASYINKLESNAFMKLQDQWFLELKEYDLEDVEEKLKEYLADEYNNASIPTPFQLKKGLYRTNQKFEVGKIYSNCRYCNKILEHGEKLDKHESRCRSVNYLKRLYPKYIGREIDKETEKDLKNMNQYKFDETYYLILKKVHEVMPEGFDKQLLTNVLETG